MLRRNNWQISVQERPPGSLLCGNKSIGFHRWERTYREEVYMEKEYEEDEDFLKFYDSIGMFNGTISYEIYDKLCKKMIG